MKYLNLLVFVLIAAWLNSLVFRTCGKFSTSTRFISHSFAPTEASNVFHTKPMHHAPSPPSNMSEVLVRFGNHSFGDVSVTRSSTDWYIISNGFLHFLSSCTLPCSKMNFCSAADFSRIPWRMVKHLPVAKVAYNCSGQETLPFKALDAHEGLSITKMITAKDEYDHLYLVYNNTALRLLTCMECGPLYGSICERFPGTTQISVVALSRIGRWTVNAGSFDLTGRLIDRLAEAAPIFACQRDMPDMIQSPMIARWLIITTVHVLFMAYLIADMLRGHGFLVEVTLTLPSSYLRQANFMYVVLGAMIYNARKLPPADRRIVVQLEQRSSKWFTDSYLHVLRTSYAVLEYDLGNIAFLNKQNVNINRIWFLPVGANSEAMRGTNNTMGKKWDLLFYGAPNPRRNQMLKDLSAVFKVKIVTGTFGKDMQSLIKQARFVINIHYYMPPSLEVFRIYEALSLGIPVISEDAPDRGLYPDFKSAVHFFDLDSTSSMMSVVRSALGETQGKLVTDVRDVVETARMRFCFCFDRFLYGMELLPLAAMQQVTKHVSIQFPTTITEPLILSIPEEQNRRLQHLNATRITTAPIFYGVRLPLRAPWISCGMSYALLADLVLQAGVKKVAIAEGDAIFLEDYTWKIGVIEEYLNKLDNEWDVFSGDITDMHPKARILSHSLYKGVRFFILDRMGSMVHNIYNTRALELMRKWGLVDHDTKANTIDRYLELQLDLKVVITVPFLTGHWNEGNSTSWELKNTTQVAMQRETPVRIMEMVAEYEKKHQPTA